MAHGGSKPEYTSDTLQANEWTGKVRLPASRLFEMIRRTLVFFGACLCLAGDWTLGITSFNSPKRITVEAEPGTTLRLASGSRRIVLPHGSTAGLLASGNEIDVFARRVTSTSRQVRITGFDGGPATFSLRDGVNRRRYVGVLEVDAEAGILRLKCHIPAAVAPPAGQPRHRGFDFCDQAHCGFSSRPGR
jgi:hypothetical protein